jgi:hypothetical protein
MSPDSKQHVSKQCTDGHLKRILPKYAAEGERCKLAYRGTDLNCGVIHPMT